VTAGDADTFYLNNAVHPLQNAVDNTRKPHSDATFLYGAGQPHCYVGGPAEYTMQQSHLTWVERVLPLMADHMLETAPAGADTRSWRY
jgi:hypothetical protein